MLFHLGDTLFDSLRFCLELLQIFAKAVDHLVARYVSPLESRFSLRLVTSACATGVRGACLVSTLMSVPAAPATAVMPFLPVTVLFSMVSTMLSAAAVF
jgi:hypothetical protein